MNEQLGEGGTPSPEPLGAAEEWTIDKKIIAGALAVVLLSFAGCAASSFVEIANLRSQEAAIIVSWKPAETIKVALNPSIHPTKLLPEKVEGYEVRALQPVPGAKSYAAEAIYSPTNEEAQIKLPRNVYVNITYHSTPKKAEAGLESWYKSYPKNQGSIDEQGLKAKDGLNLEESSYLIGWVIDRYSVQVEGNFLDTAPADKHALLRALALPIAKDIADRASKIFEKQE